ncbi:MAG TPA: hypothetical protein VEU76_07455 [Candidatus Udaeobacter sp.]|nr:hypothetical protein [Candidatus Udaeobacter sp.]
MDDLIRATIRRGLADGTPPPGLRSRVIAAVPMDRRATLRWRGPRVSGQWAAGFAAILLTAALVAGLVYSRISSQVGLQHTPPAPPARLSRPSGLAVAPDGSLYVADYVGNRVYRVEADGSLVTVAGGGLAYEGSATKANLYTPAGLAFDANGNLFIADNLGTTIRKVDRNGMLSTFLPIHATGGVNSPLGLAFDRAGLLYVGDLAGGVAAVRPDGSFETIDLSGLPSPAVLPGYLAFDSAGDLYVTDRSPYAYVAGQVPTPPGGCRIIRIKPDRSAQVIAGTGRCGYSGDGGPATSAQLDNPNGLAFDSGGNLYVADTNNHRVRRIDNRGTITTVAGTGISGHSGDGGLALKAGLVWPEGLVAVDGKLLYVSDSCGCTDPAAYGAVRVIDLPSGTISTLVNSNSRVIR